MAYIDSCIACMQHEKHIHTRHKGLIKFVLKRRLGGAMLRNLILRRGQTFAQAVSVRHRVSGRIYQGFRRFLKLRLPDMTISFRIFV